MNKTIENIFSVHDGTTQIKINATLIDLRGNEN